MLLAAQASFDAFYVLAFMGAWFAQMGVHEGFHAFMADRLGDHVPRVMGKCTLNPFKHIEWNNPRYVIFAVVMPLITTLQTGWPMGMAWVMHSRMDPKSEAKIAIAGPIGSMVVAAVALVIWWAVFPFESNMDPAVWSRVELLAAAFVVTSVIYGLFNLVPLPPVDGGTVAYYFLNDDGRRFFDRIRPYGFFIVIGVFFLLMMMGLNQPIFDKLYEAIGWMMFKIPAQIYG